MPRQERTKSGTGIYHVMLRGINRQDIFEDAEDYLQMVACLRMITEPSPGSHAFNSLGKSLKENAGNSTLGNNGKFYWHASGENGFYGNQYVKTAKLANFGSGILRVTGPVGLLLSGNELYNGYQLDGGDVQTVGYNTVRAMASVAGGWAVGTAGLKIGAAIGFGLGNVPGSVIGGAVGGFLGTFGGSWFGTNYIDYLYGK